MQKKLSAKKCECRKPPNTPRAPSRPERIILEQRRPPGIWSSAARNSSPVPGDRVQVIIFELPTSICKVSNAMIHSHDTSTAYIYSVHNHTIIFETPKTVFPGTYYGFDICNPKLFALKSRPSIVPSFQNINLIQFLMILMSKNNIFEKCRKSFLTGAIIRKKCAEFNGDVRFVWNLLK